MQQQQHLQEQGHQQQQLMHQQLSQQPGRSLITR
jgi:hypothetical protein